MRLNSPGGRAKTTLVKLGLEAVIARESATRLAELGGTKTQLPPPEVGISFDGGASEGHRSRTTSECTSRVSAFPGLHPLRGIAPGYGDPACFVAETVSAFSERTGSAEVSPRHQKDPSPPRPTDLPAVAQELTACTHIAPGTAVCCTRRTARSSEYTQKKML
jgi:hypothetical protein